MRARRNARWMAAGVMAVCLGGLGAALLYGNLSNAHSVITVTRTVFRDQVITADDLGVTSASDVAGVDTVPVERIDEVVGRTALQDLTQGSLLSPRAYGEAAVETGSVRVGLRLAAGRIPSSPMPPGTEVLLVPVARDGGDVPEGASVAGRIATEPSTLPDGASVVDVTVASSEAERVARLAAGDQLVLVRLAGRPR
ncbi:SAF domain-containing protein [Propionicimonas sp.]|uniref:SAF domain-containing protein n=1 Tax=Propionicimonas sp. TaxID=1955623 RepID=UPI0039E70B08